MPKIFDIKAIDSELGDGELHLHEAQDSCSSLFRNPNRNSLKGIAPHVHHSCDDIEVLLRGKIILPSAPKRGYSVAAPALIINRAGEVHGFIADSVGAAVLGIRCPKDYRGRSVELGSPIVWCGRVIPIDESGLKEYRAPHCTVRIRTLGRGDVCAVAPHSGAEYVGVLLCEDALLSCSDGTSKSVNGDALIFSTNNKISHIAMHCGGVLIEILPNQGDGGEIV